MFSFGVATEVVGADFKTVFEIQAVRVGAIVVDVDVEVDFGYPCFRADFADFFQKARGVAFAAALRQGYDVVDVDVAAAGEGAGFAESADGDGVVFAFFKNAQQAVALGALDFVDLFGKAADVGQGGTQNAQGCKGGGRVFRADFAQNVGCARDGLFLCFLGGVFFFDCLCQWDVSCFVFVCFSVFALFDQCLAVDDAQVVVGGKVHQEAEHLWIVGFQFFIDGDAADVVH